MIFLHVAEVLGCCCSFGGPAGSHSCFAAACKFDEKTNTSDASLVNSFFELHKQAVALQQKQDSLPEYETKQTYDLNAVFPAHCILFLACK
jgi:hypothetical protein